MYALLFAIAAQAIDRPAPFPEPLEPAEFSVPDASFRELSNGMEIIVVENHEVPMWEARVIFGVGGYTDPADKIGTADLAFDLMTTATDNHDAQTLSRTVKKLGAEMYTDYRGDYAALVAGGIVRTMDETLDLLAEAIRTPAYAADDFEIAQRRRRAKLKVDLEKPGTIAWRVDSHTRWGDSYLGRFATDEGYAAISRDDLVAFHKTYVGPENALILVGGDVDPDTVAELLEAKLGDWEPADIEVAPVKAEPKPIEAKLYFVDMPGASQSTIHLTTQVVVPTDEIYPALEVANHAVGGSFTSRINMNLREDKGYTYGARCFTHHRHGPAFLTCNTAVRADATRASLDEIKRELEEALGDRPPTDEEIADAKGDMTLGYPGRFETTDAILATETRIWRYGLADDFIAQYIPLTEAVTTEAAISALRGQLDLAATHWVVVGDKATIFADLDGFGLPIVELDKQVRPVE